jgi:hypothetical protein
VKTSEFHSRGNFGSLKSESLSSSVWSRSTEEGVGPRAQSKIFLDARGDSDVAIREVFGALLE